MESEVLNLLVFEVGFLFELVDLLIMGLELNLGSGDFILELFEFKFDIVILIVEGFVLLIFGLYLCFKEVDSLEMELRLFLRLCQILLEELDFILQSTDLLQVWVNVLVHGRLFCFIFMYDSRSG